MKSQAAKGPLFTLETNSKKTHISSMIVEGKSL